MREDLEQKLQEEFQFMKQDGVDGETTKIKAKMILHIL